MHDRAVFPADLARLRSRIRKVWAARVFATISSAAGVPVEPVHEARARHLGERRAVLQQPVQQGIVRVARRRDARPARRACRSPGSTRPRGDRERPSPWRSIARSAASVSACSSSCRRSAHHGARGLRRRRRRAAALADPLLQPAARIVRQQAAPRAWSRRARRLRSAGILSVSLPCRTAPPGLPRLYLPAPLAGDTLKMPPSKTQRPSEHRCDLLLPGSSLVWPARSPAAQLGKEDECRRDRAERALYDTAQEPRQRQLRHAIRNCSGSRPASPSAPTPSRRSWNSSTPLQQLRARGGRGRADHFIRTCTRSTRTSTTPTTWGPGILHRGPGHCWSASCRRTWPSATPARRGSPSPTSRSCCRASRTPSTRPTARARMVLLRNLLARYEINVAKYYLAAAPMSRR